MCCVGLVLNNHANSALYAQYEHPEGGGGAEGGREGGGGVVGVWMERMMIPFLFYYDTLSINSESNINGILYILRIC